MQNDQIPNYETWTISHHQEPAEDGGAAVYWIVQKGWRFFMATTESSAEWLAETLNKISDEPSN